MRLKEWIKNQRILPSYLIGLRIRIIGIPVLTSNPIETIVEGIVKNIDENNIYFENGKLVWNGDWFDNCLKIQIVDDIF